jgi:hypothetical protein
VLLAVEGALSLFVDAQVRNAKPKAAGYRMPDGGGLHLYVSPKGAKIWRLRYKVRGDEQTLVLGPYRTISLADARARPDVARAALAAGTDPRRPNIAATTAPTLIEMVREWH